MGKQHSLYSMLAVAAGGIVGANIRYAISNMLPFQAESGFPYATLLVNLSGACFLGWLTGWLAQRPSASPLWKQTLGVGLAGALTTFSTFSMETVLLLQAGKWSVALLYQGISLFAGILFAWSGYGIGERIRFNRGC